MFFFPDDAENEANTSYKDSIMVINLKAAKGELIDKDVISFTTAAFTLQVQNSSVMNSS